MKLAIPIAIALLVGIAAADDSFVDPRSHEVLRFSCTTGLMRSDLTLFGNGTMRLWEGEVGSEMMSLSELDPDSFEAYMGRFRAEAFGDLNLPLPVDGLFTEQCVLTLDVDDGPVGSASFGSFDSKSLPLSRLITIARELSVLSRAQIQVGSLNASYKPRRGDVLIHRDGTRYRVHSFTSDGLGLELNGIEQPLTIYVAIEALPGLFLALEE